MASTSITQVHVGSIIGQNRILAEKNEDGNDLNELKNMCRRQKNENLSRKKIEVDSFLTDEMLNFVRQARDKGASSWLNALPIESQMFSLNALEFRDALKLRYGLRLENLPSKCTCDEKFDVYHALSCKKGGFVTQRHDNIRNLFATLLNQTCKDVMVEPPLNPVLGVKFPKSTNTEDEARLDIKARSFWRNGQTAFFDVRITHVNSNSNEQKDTNAIFKQNEDEKKRQYLKRVLEIEHGTFTPLVMGTNGGMGKECSRFLTSLAQKLAEKQNEEYGIIVSWIRTRLSFEILKSAILCVRGSRAPFRKHDNEAVLDFKLNSNDAKLL